jgi:hypothetical protein
MSQMREEFLLYEIFTRFHKYHINRMAEIGVGDGNFSMFLAKTIPVAEFYGIDPYLKYDDYTDLPQRAREFYDSQTGLDTLYDMTTYVYEGNENMQLIRKTSVEAAADFEDSFFDVVYIDANHNYEYVKQDLEAWWPKIISGGVLCGDDYEPAGVVDFGVIQAVDEFAEANNLEVNIGDCWWKQWWISKD